MAERSSTLVRFSASGTASRRLYCFPFAGGAASTYRTWPTSLPDDVEVVFIQFPGRTPGSPDAPLTRMADLVEVACAAIDGDADLPYAFFGHSMGAATAYEVTSRLEQAGSHRPDQLFVSGRRSPSDHHPSRPIRDLPDDAFVAAMGERYGAIPDAIRNEPDVLAMFLPILRADVVVFETYERLTDHRVECPVSVFGGTEDTNPPPDALAGWSEVTARPVLVDVFPGDHFYLNHQGPAITNRIGTRWLPGETSSPQPPR